MPLNVELKLEVWDSPNSAGIVIDAVRLIKLALDNGISGALEWPVRLPHEVAAASSIADDQARDEVEDFIRRNSRTAAKTAAATAQPAGA